MSGQHRSGSSGQHRLAPSPELLRHWRVVRWLLATVVGSIAFGSWWFVTASADTPERPAAKPGGMAANWPTGSTSAAPATAAATLAEPSPTRQPLGNLTLTASGPGKLVAGSDPRDLPRPLLIADEDNNRLLIIDRDGRSMWEFPRKGDLAPGQTFKSPDDAYFTPDGNQIIATQGDDNVISVIDIATRKIVYTFGKSGVAGSGPNRLNGPDDAMMMPNGDIVASDISNCRIIMIPKGAHAVVRQIGRVGTCQHKPKALGSPSGAFPMMNGNYLVSEINGGWISEMSLSGRVLWSTKVPTVAYISDPNEISKDRYLTVDYSTPGQVVTFNRAGKVLWRYAPTGEMALKKPSQAMPLPNGNYMVADRGNHRLIIVAPGNKAVLWQYGHTGVPGNAPGYLNNPTGMDFLPPDSLLVKHGASMGKIPR